MFRWFGGSSPGHDDEPPLEVVTDDPLATIALSLPRVRRIHSGKSKASRAKARRPKEIYAVSRVNPIFEDEEGAGSSASDSTKSSAPASPGQSGGGSSGYDSNPAERTPSASSEFSDEGGPRPGIELYLLAAAALAAPATAGGAEGQVPAPVWPEGGHRAEQSAAASRLQPPPGPVASSQQPPPPPPPPPWRHPWHPRLSPDDPSPCCDLPPGAAGMPPAQTHPPPPPRCPSATSSSGYSDHSLVLPPPGLYLQKPETVTGQEMALVRGSVRNAMIYGTLNRIKCASGLGVYERLLGFWRSQQLEARLLSSSSSSSNDKTDGSTSSKASWQSFPDSGSPTPSKKSIPQDFDKTARYFPPSQRPDFTLDIPAAERVMRKIAAAKRRRCWCQLSVSILGLIFFMLSVMAVSMMYTGGQRMFGSL